MKSYGFGEVWWKGPAVSTRNAQRFGCLIAREAPCAKQFEALRGPCALRGDLPTLGVGTFAHGTYDDCYAALLDFLAREVDAAIARGQPAEPVVRAVVSNA